MHIYLSLILRRRRRRRDAAVTVLRFERKRDTIADSIIFTFRPRIGPG